ncbi:hypothetical protein [Flavobacterium sp.]|jgi:hypothetical protein|uniref:hypothetical protein n=1 Tax=Flavobacterium sp. TaxID=239 RepID=UPI0037BF37AB
MAKIKLTTSNYSELLDDWANGIATDNVLFFIKSEINENEIYQTAWIKNLLIQISSFDNFISKITYIDTIN